MDKQLAEFYGTNQVDADDLEKMASAELAEALADEGNAEFDGLTDEDLEAAALEILAEEGDVEGDVEVDGTEKIASDYDHADRMGRIMAHAYVQELNGIEKEASRAAQRHGAQSYTKGGALNPSKLNTMAQLESGLKTQAAEAAEKKRIGAPLKSTGSRKEDMARGNRASKFNESMAKNEAVAAKANSAPAKAGRAISGAARRAMSGLKSMGGKVGKHVMTHADKYGPAAIIGGGALAAGAMARKEKRSSATPALDALIEARAAEILEANGIDPETFEYTKQSSVGTDVLGDVVEGNAIALLQELGYEFE